MWQLGAGSGAALRRPEPPPSRPPPGVHGSWAIPSPITRLVRERGGIGVPPTPEREGRSSLRLRLRSELPPEAAAGSSLPAGGAARQGALLAQRSGVPVLGLSPGGRDLPRARGFAPGPRRPPGRPGSLARRLRRHRQTAGSCAGCTARGYRGTRRGRNVHAVPDLLFSLAAWEGEGPTAEAVRARDGPSAAPAARLVGAGSRAASEDAGVRGPFRGAGGGSGGAG